MDEKRYAEEFELAEKLKGASEFADARKHYRKAMRFAAPLDMQMLVDKVRETTTQMQMHKKKPSVAKSKVDGFKVHKLTFKDIIGYKIHKKITARTIKQPLEKGEKYTKMRMPKSTGILLYGPPGTGKTTFSKAISGEYNLPMKDILISDILGKLVGESEKNIKQAFADAKGLQPSLLFFDEIDALASSREDANSSTSNELKNTVNEFMKQLSELHQDKETRVFVIGATNLPWMVDMAMKRSGRLEHHIYMGPPSFGDRRKLFQYHLKDCSKGINYTLLAMATMRYSQSDIETVCTNAKRTAVDKNREYVTMRDVQTVLKDKIEGRSSLDEWFLKAKNTYLKQEKTVVHKTGFLNLRKKKEKVEEQGKFSDEEMRIYKPLINSIKSNLRWWLLADIVRVIGRGF